MMLVYRDTFVGQNVYGGAASAMLVALITIVSSVALFWVTRRRSQGKAI
jgi:ABC-type sugar transport system permease subunit